MTDKSWEQEKEKKNYSIVGDLSVLCGMTIFFIYISAEERDMGEEVFQVKFAGFQMLNHLSNCEGVGVMETKVNPTSVTIPYHMRSVARSLTVN